jgi:hypothetical protein
VTIRLETSIKRYIGLSTDQKPRPGVQGPDGTTFINADMPPGTTLLEADTGRLWRWTGTDWILGAPDDATARLVAAVEALHQEVAALRSGMIAAETCLYVEPEDVFVLTAD